MSWFEVEAKIKIKDPKKIKNKLEKFATYTKKEIKSDSYYTLENYKKKHPKKSLRIRNVPNKKIVNFKQWISYNNGIYVKKEIEFTIKDFKKFLSLLKEFGFKKWVTKIKECYTYEYKSTMIELNKVKHLGWFLEIECLCNKKSIPKAKRKIKNVIQKLNLKSSNFEKKDILLYFMKKRKETKYLLFPYQLP